MDKFFKLSLMFFLLLIFLSCANKSSQQNIKQTKQNTANQIIIGSIGDAIKLNPILYDDSASGDVLGFLIDGLVTINDKLEIIPAIAKNWTASKDGLDWTFNLKQNVKWWDGKPVTAEDVKFTIEKILDKKVNSIRRSDYELIEKITLVNPYQIKFKLKKPFAPFLSNMGIGLLPKHILEKEKDLNTSSFSRKPLGNGLYIFKEWITKDHITMIKNPNYYDGSAHIDKVIFKVVPDQNVLLMQLQKGEIDVMETILPKDYPVVKNNPDIKTYIYDVLMYTYFGFNLKRKIFQDVKVRRAIAYAMDRESMIKSILKGFGSVATGPIPPISWAYNPKVTKYNYNPEKAKQLLSSAGWKDVNGDGILEKDGHPFTFELLTNEGNEIRKNLAVIIQNQLKQVGIEMKIKIIDWGAFIETYINKRNFDATILGWSLGIDPDPYGMWHSSEIKNGNNFISYNNPEIDKLLEAGRTTIDKNARKKIYDKFQQIIVADCPYVFLYYPKVITGVRNRFEGIKSINAAGIFLHVKDWKIKEIMTK